MTQVSRRGLLTTAAATAAVLAAPDLTTPDLADAAAAAEGCTPVPVEVEVEPAPTTFGISRAGREYSPSPEPELILHPKWTLPDWLLELKRNRASDEDILRKLVERVRGGQSDLHEARRILNDIGSHEGGDRLLTTTITQRLLLELSLRR